MCRHSPDGTPPRETLQQNPRTGWRVVCVKISTEMLSQTPTVQGYLKVGEHDTVAAVRIAP
jgi:hypothetical protein